MRLLINKQRSQLASLAAVVAIAILLLNLGCTAQPAKARSSFDLPPGGTLLHGAGATFPSPLYRNWFAAYERNHPSAVIAYDAVGSGEGVRRFSKSIDRAPGQNRIGV